jgi:hypothetical protein
MLQESKRMDEPLAPTAASESAETLHPKLLCLLISSNQYLKSNTALVE